MVDTVPPTIRKEDGKIMDGEKIVTGEMTIINESGLYSLILRSRKPEPKAFKKLVTGTVLPAIRKDGGNIIGEEKVKSGEMSGEELLSRAPTVIRKYDRSGIPP